MRWTVCRPDSPPLAVDADSHHVEGAHHVFRRDALVLGRPRAVVVLRLPVAGVVDVRVDVPGGTAPHGGDDVAHGAAAATPAPAGPPVDA